MQYVYILRSLSDPDRHYVGTTHDLRERLDRHNAGIVSHTAKYGPWQIQTYLAFADRERALAFEKYLKSASGRAFSRKRL
jgi:putative endonuclease